MDVSVPSIRGLLGLSSRDLVSGAMKGEANRIPLYFWLADPQLEASVGDIVGVRCWFNQLDFLETGGPFRRRGETRREWCDRLQPDEYGWPSVDNLVPEMDRILADATRADGGKSFQLEILGPTECSEYSCSPGVRSRERTMDQVSHQFDFSILTVLDPPKADTIHKRFFDLVRDVARRATEYEAVDSIRIADDFCSYMGSTYRPDFTETIVRRQVELGRVITEGGKYSVLHADGDVSRYLLALAHGYSGFHPLDIRPKSTVANAHEWAATLVPMRRLLPEAVFFTGIPVDLLCSSDVSAEELVDVVRHVIDAVGQDRLVLTTTHRPYPGWSFRDFEEKVHAIKKFLQSVSRP